MQILVMVAWGDKPPSPGWYLTRALKRMGHTVFTVGPNCQINTKNINPYPKLEGIIRRKKANLVIEVDSGGFELNWNPLQETRNKFPGVKFVYWGSDTHLNGAEGVYKNKQRHYNVAFFAQKKFIDRNSQRRFWLPHACDPQFHKIKKTKDEHKVSFVGNKHPLVHGLRIQLFKRLANSGVGLYNKNYVYLEKMGQIYANSKVVLNCSLNGDLNMRFFEGLCSGSCVLTDWSDDAGFEDLGFKRGVHFCAYSDQNHAVRAIKKLLGNNEYRESVAKQGQELVLAKHTYEHRAKYMLENI